jgi:hypothetical protein
VEMISIGYLSPLEAQAYLRGSPAQQAVFFLIVNLPLAPAPSRSRHGETIFEEEELPKVAQGTDYARRALKDRQ